ncbi:hypothetical protein HPB47_003755 [Ixodes persulcatus]|uniref:Uncharacterized protein n=1 Tax=Ixodes persulcatus TaxID=34615 RepID=A0AC60PIK1_IXOPE|nr:hypothetical protein HPB47_003755 [Ixodes persulcatus]
MSLMPLEMVFIVGDQAYHLTRAALDLALLVDACVYGVHTVEAVVRVVAGLCMLTFHALFLGPRSSLTSDAAMFFGDMLYHFFHMLLSTWRLLLILWTVQPREFLILIVLWVDFFFHVAVVWFYSGGIQVTVRMQFVEGPADAPRPLPQPPQPPPPPAELFAAGPDIMGPIRGGRQESLNRSWEERMAMTNCARSQPIWLARALVHAEDILQLPTVAELRIQPRRVAVAPAFLHALDALLLK